MKFKITKIGLWPLKIKIVAAVTAGIIIMGGVSAAVVLNKKPTDSDKKASLGNSSVVAPKYTTSVTEDGTVVVVDNEGNTVDNAEITEDGSIVIKNDKGEIAESISGDNVKKYEEVKNEENKSENKPNNPESKPSESKPTESNQSGGSTETGDSGKYEESKPSESKPEEPNRTFVEPTEAELKKMEEVFFEYVNKERISLGVPALIRKDELDRAANIRSNELKVLFSHTRPDNRDCYSVYTDIKYGIKSEDIWSDDGVNWNRKEYYSVGAAAENISYDRESKSAYMNYNNIGQSFFYRFKVSPGHYANMIDKATKYTGISIIYEINGNDITFYCTHLFTEK